MMKTLITGVFLVALATGISARSKDDVNCIKCVNCALMEMGNLDICAGKYCFSKFVNGTVQRGCSKKSACKDEDKYCEQCQNNFCNNEDVEFQTCFDSHNNTVICRPSSLCYYYEKGDVVQKGCLDDVSEAMQLECSSFGGEYCKICYQKGCNANAPLKCFKCNAQDESCAREHDATLHMVDTPDLCSYEQSLCYVEGNGSGTERGCMADREAGRCNQTTGCRACTEDGCNSEETRPALSCIKCDTYDNGCDEGTLPAQPCTRKIQYGDQDSCYSFKDEAHRGCLSDLIEYDYLNNIDCIFGKTCHLCDTDGCNTEPVSAEHGNYCSQPRNYLQCMLASVYRYLHMYFAAHNDFPDTALSPLK